MIEKWLPIKDFHGYEVSNKGYVRSLDREIPVIKRGCSQTISHRRKLKGKKLSIWESKEGLEFVSLKKKGATYHRAVKTLMEEAFRK